MLSSYSCSCLVTKSCPALCDPMDCSPPGSSVHEVSQTRILEWIAISFSKGSSQPRDQTHISCLAGCFFTTAPYFTKKFGEAFAVLLIKSIPPKADLFGNIMVNINTELIKRWRIFPTQSNVNTNNITNTIYITLYNWIITLPCTVSGRIILQLLAEK